MKYRWVEIPVVGMATASLVQKVKLLHEGDYYLHAYRKIPMVLTHVHLEASVVPSLYFISITDCIHSNCALLLY